MNIQIRNTEQIQVNNLTIYLKVMEKQEQFKCKANTRKKILSVKLEFKEIKICKKIQLCSG